MATTTITLDRQAYELLRFHKRPDESFSEEVRRLLQGSQPSLRGFLSLFSKGDSIAIAEAVEELREQDLAEERRRVKAGRPGRGRRA